jgi:hypothetical protein
MLPVGMTNSLSHVGTNTYLRICRKCCKPEQSILYIATYAGCASTWKLAETRCSSYFNCSDYSEVHKNS